jgi:hypothetical protein
MGVSSTVSGIESLDRVPHWTQAGERVALNSEFPCLLKGRDTLTSFRVDIAVVE